jgi:hypothetical protein
MACMDLRSLSLNSPAMYSLAASRCGRRVKHALKPSMNCPNRRRSARASSAVTDATVRNPVAQYKHNPPFSGAIQRFNVTR